MPTFTTNYNFNKPLVNNATDADLWGGQLNTNFDSLDSIIFNGTGYNGGTAAGTANAITATPTPALTAYSNLDGKVMALKIANANTSGTVTMQLSGLSTPPSVKKFIGGSKVDLAVGDLQAGMMGLFSRDGTDIILLNPRGYSQGADIASASTVNLETATGDYVVVTGTTTITAITLSQGREVTVRFSGILTLTNGASLILPSGANITTAAGDIAVFRGEASGVVRCVNYARASGAPLTGGGVTKATTTISSVASVTFSSLDFQNNEYEFILKEIQPATNSQNFIIEISTDNFATDTTDVIVSSAGQNTAAFDAITASTGTLVEAQGNANSQPYLWINGYVRLSQLISGRSITGEFQVGYGKTGSGVSNQSGTLSQLIADLPSTFFNAVRFKFASGNLASGYITILTHPRA